MLKNDLAEPQYGRGKHIRVWVNGDARNECHDVFINPNNLRSWNAILVFLTDYLQPKFGAVRKVFSLETGHSVCCFQDLHPKEKYVVGPLHSKLQTIPHG